MKKDMKTYEYIKKVLEDNKITREDLEWYNSVCRTKYIAIHKNQHSLSEGQIKEISKDVLSMRKKQVSDADLYLEETFPLVNSRDLPACARAGFASMV